MDYDNIVRDLGRVMDVLREEIDTVEGALEAVAGQIATCTDRDSLADLRDEEEQLRDEEKQLHEAKKVLYKLMHRHTVATTVPPPTAPHSQLLDSNMAIPWLDSPMHRELVVLGELCMKEDFDSFKDLHSLLEAMASALALTPDGLLKADWFMQ
ncbi:hypothetical protein VOLCADRAFT_108726, partial [Volvox carteri f. nagariensis]